MATLMGLLSLGASSLAAQQAGVSVSGNNIANARTPGYSRRQLTIDEGRGVVIGGGAVATSVNRAQDFILSQQLADQQGALSLASRSATGLSDIESLFQAGQNSLASTVTNLAQSFSQLSAAPQDLTRRADVVEKGRSVVLEFNRVGGQLSARNAANVSSARDLVPAINDAAVQIANLNRSILGGPPAILPPAVAGANNANQDQRDVLAQKLADLSGGQLLRNDNGTYDILVGGLSLVHGAVAQALSVTPKADGSLSVSVGDQVLRGPPGGQLGGVLQAQTTTLRAQRQLDQLAYDLTSALNAQHALGVGLDGQGGRPFFAPLAGPSAAATLVKLDTNLSARTVAAGLTAAPGDNRNAAALANLIDQPVLDGGRANFQNVYSSIVSALGFDVQRARADQSTAGSRQQALQTQQQSISGVSTDEEMTQVLAYQRAFEASSQFLKTVDEMLQTLQGIRS